MVLWLVVSLIVYSMRRVKWQCYTNVSKLDLPEKENKEFIFIYSRETYFNLLNDRSRNYNILISYLIILLTDLNYNTIDL